MHLTQKAKLALAKATLSRQPSLRGRQSSSRPETGGRACTRTSRANLLTGELWVGLAAVLGGLSLGGASLLPSKPFRCVPPKRQRHHLRLHIVARFLGGDIAANVACSILRLRNPNTRSCRAAGTRAVTSRPASRIRARRDQPITVSTGAGTSGGHIQIITHVRYMKQGYPSSPNATG